jgi:hypothetical protein
MRDNGGQVFLNLIISAVLIALCVITYNFHISEKKILDADGERIAALESMNNDIKELDQNLGSLQKLLAPEGKPPVEQHNEPVNAPAAQETSSQTASQNPPLSNAPSSNISSVNLAQPSTVESGNSLPDHRPSQQVVMNGPVRIELSKCRANGVSATCTFIMQDKGKDCYFNFYTDSSHVYDNRGYEAKAVDAVIANNRMANTLGFGRMVYARMITNVSANAIFRFENIAPDATSIALIELQMDINHQQKFEIQFRNVPLIR